MNLITLRIKIKANIHLLTVLGMCAIFLTEAFAQGQPQGNTDAEESTFKPEISYTAEKFRDPFTNPVRAEILNSHEGSDPNVPEIPLPPMQVQGIFWGGKFPQAIINDKIVKVGETIEGAQVVAIEKDLVTVFFGDKKFDLPSPASNNLAASSNKKDGQKGGN